MSELNDHQRQEILNAIKAGRKIEAIKLYREQTGCGLKESKEFIEALTDQLLADDPEAVVTSKSGCGIAVVAILLITGSIGAMMS